MWTTKGGKPLDRCCSEALRKILSSVPSFARVGEPRSSPGSGTWYSVISMPMHCGRAFIRKSGCSEEPASPSGNSGPKHLLVGLVDEFEERESLGVAARVLVGLGLNLQELRRRVRRELGTEE